MPYIVIVIVLVIVAGVVGLFISRDAGTASDIVTTDANGRPLTEEQRDTPTDTTPPAPVPEPEPIPADPLDEAVGTSTDETVSVDEMSDSASKESSDESETAAEETASGATGSFSGEASYSTGRAIHELVVTFTLENDIVVATDILYDGDGVPATPTLTNFNDAYEVEVIGKDIDDIQLSRVGGASWTSNAFNEAVAEIKAEASV